MEELEKLCINCEYFDIGLYKPGDSNSDCHNQNSPRFTPEPNFSCRFFYPSSTLNLETNLNGTK